MVQLKCVLYVGSSFNEGSMAWLKTGGLIKSVCAPTVLKDKHCRRHIPIMGSTGASGNRFVYKSKFEIVM